VSSSLLSFIVFPIVYVCIIISEEHAREVVGDADLNGDGVISYEEWRPMMMGQKFTKVFIE